MSTSKRELNQEILLEIMLQAYQLGVQRKDVDLNMMIHTLTDELKPYFEQQIQQGQHASNRLARVEATG
ncbi:hypothetical protein BAG01nite_16530 [Brevibacillus agri]|uniref:Uncharacterized protein n=1 Tax=Brevibacillus agri TaxID=51101 RepID=A0A3M8AXE1_9BACL|nr:MULTISPECIES: hypothetical protein [Brevibacillus]ELK41613.1 hypothetical protein D478_13028 [Brevibacillus agri BAB-2500]EJL43515.1 hypothetical protein PMI08_02527 [Brevibacillus sp. CF112]MBG9567233.1 hypothetical protein [Brevibacillus agri]MBY0052833.1 hypothetical protein [Brevibacillus agri]MCG5253577.1 hypothetical protein [Brevibacillus agri]